MTQENPPSGDSPKKATLKLLLRSRPATDVETSAGRIYLYPLRMRDMADFEKLESGDAVSQIRAFLPNIGSLTVESDEAPERVPLDAAIATGLSNDEIEWIADAYVRSSAWQTTRESSERKPVVREEGETASAYLIRLVKDEIQHQHDAAKQLHEKIVGSSRGLFDQVRRSYTDLGSTVKAFESISRPTLEPSLSRNHLEINNHLAEHSARMARERSEELEMVRLTGQMTAESAKTLKDLAEAATTLLEQMDERDRRTDQSTRKQITIAVWSVGISAVLALFALIVSSFAYVQDRDSSSSEEQWQVKLLAAVEQGNRQRSAAEHENEALREQVSVLGARIAVLEAAQHAATAKKAEDATPPHAAMDSSAAQQ